MLALVKRNFRHSADDQDGCAKGRDHVRLLRERLWFNGGMPPRLCADALFSLRQEFSTHWNRLLFPAEGQDQGITLNLGKQHFPGYLDYMWVDTDDDGKLDTQRPITLRVTSLKVYLDPQGQLPSDATALSINGTTSEINVVNGLPVFDLGFTGEITNESEIDLTLTVSPDERLQATDWKDMYLLLNYEVSEVA